MSISPITDMEFTYIQRLMHEYAGISLTPEKSHGRQPAGEKDSILSVWTTTAIIFDWPIGENDRREFEIMVNILTTNETYFFREPKHFRIFPGKHTEKLAWGTVSNLERRQFHRRGSL